MARIPLEMTGPLLLPGVEKTDNGVGYRVDCFDVIVFPVVATLAGICKVVKVICSSFSDGYDMFNRKESGEKSA